MLYVYIFRKNIRRILFYNISLSVQYMQIGYQFHFKQIIIKIWLYYEDTRNSPVETDLFLVSSCYYNPEWGRWISPDDIEYLDPSSINGLNLYCYCMNNPINMYDPSGHFATSIGIGLSTAAYYALIALAVIATTTAIATIEAETYVISNTINTISDKIDDTLENVKDTIVAYTTSLVPKNDYNSFEKHHIIARTDRRAWFSRLILSKSGIDINDYRNLVYVRKGYHRVLHTNLYYSVLNVSMGAGYLINGSEGVEDVLDFYKVVLGGL